MNDKYVVVNNIKAGIKLSESSRYYVNDIIVMGIMAFLALIINNSIYEKLQIPFVIFNVIVGAYMTSEISDSFVFYPLKNQSQHKRTAKMLEELKDEKKGAY